MDYGLLHEGIGLIHGVPHHGVELPEKKNVVETRNMYIV